jgi:GNAT superfamily N-acetyltransferase
MNLFSNSLYSYSFPFLPYFPFLPSFNIFILIFFIIIILFFAYIRIRFPFWALQPVFHIYDIGYLVFPPGIIRQELPEKNKFTNFKNIETFLYSDLLSYKKTKFVHFIRNHYLNIKGQEDNIFSPKSQNIIPYFQNHNDKCFFSFYRIQELVTDIKTGTIEEHEKMIGVMTSRPIHISILKDFKLNHMDAYYVDYLCVHKNHRKQNIAPQLIQTHEYHQRHRNKKIFVSLFKREGVLTGIVPLCVYKTYGFSVKKWTKPPDLPAFYTLLEINEQNFSHLHDFMKQKMNKNSNTFQFDIMIFPEVSNIIELMKTKNLFIYTILTSTNEIAAAYFYKKSCVFIEKDLEILTCIGSIYGENVNKEIFIHGFKTTFWKIAEKHRFGFAAIENISHNYIIIHNLMKKTKPEVISPTAYFFYNFAYPTFSSNKSFILI